MSKFPIDLNKFKKIRADEKTSTLQHPDGHEITIAHGKLSNKMKSDLEKLPMAQQPQMFADGSPDVQPLPTPEPPPVPTNPNGAPADANASLQTAGKLKETTDDLGPAVTKPAVNQDPYGTIQALQTQMGAAQETGKGKKAEEQAIGQQGTQNVAQEQQFQGQANAALNAFTQANTTLTNERANILKDIGAGHINPRQYLDNMSTAGKISTGIGLVLGGMGAGLTHGPNLVFQHLQDQINRDVDAQKAELGKKQNLLSHNFQQTGDLREAYGVTKMQQNDILSSHIRMTADQTADPVAKARLMQIAGMTDQETAKLQQQIAMQKMMVGGLNQQQNPESDFQTRMQFLRTNGQDALAKDMEAKHVPGVGQASKEVPADVMKEMISRQDLQNKITDLQQFASQNSGSLNPAIIKQGAAKAALAQDAYRRANAQGVFKESEKNFVGSVLGSDPTQFFEKYRAGKGYQEAGRDNLAALNNLKSGYGLMTSGGQQQSGQAANQNFGFKPRQ